MKNRKLFISLIIIACLFFLFTFIFLLGNLLSTNTTVTPSPVPSPTPVPFNFPSTQRVALPVGQSPQPSQLPLITPIIAPQSSNETSVVINNIFLHPIMTTQQGDVLFADHPRQYQILYLSQFNKFQIDVVGSPFEQYRYQAEQELLTALGITQTEACMLDVTTATSIHDNPDFAGVDYPLSFCSMGTGENK